jgi:DNA modification methylase
MIEAKTDASQLPIDQILCGDCIEVMKTLPDQSIDMTMFSPPYYGLRDYGISGQIGLEEHPSKYIEKMIEVCREVKRILKKTGSMYIVIGDTYGTHQSGGKNYSHNFRSSEVANEIGHTLNRPKVGFSGNFIMEKQLMLIPSRVAIALQEDGWILRNDIIWAKPNHMPSSVKDRLTNAYEHIFHFVKSRKYYYNLDAIREKHSTATMKRIAQPNVMNQTGGEKQERLRGMPSKGNASRCNLMVQNIAKKYEGKFTEFKEEAEKYGSPRARTQRKYDGQRVNPSEGHIRRGAEFAIAKGEGTAFHMLGKNPSDFWSITTKPFKGAHFAVYCEEVCVRPIKSSCPPNGIVLDLMCGSGTTLAVAKKLGRKYIGIELNPAYIEIANNRLAAIPEKITTFF